jgi:hypothetical protein
MKNSEKIRQKKIKNVKHKMTKNGKKTKTLKMLKP